METKSMLNRKASRTGEHSDGAAVLDMEGLVQEQFHPGNEELGLWEAGSELTWCAEQCCVLGCGVIVPGCTFWLLDSSVWLKGWCERWSPVLIISNPRCRVALQMRWTLPWAESMETFGLIKCSLQPAVFPPILLHLKAPTITSWNGHKQRITLSGKNQPCCPLCFTYRCSQPWEGSLWPQPRSFIHLSMQLWVVWCSWGLPVQLWENMSSQRWSLGRAAGTQEEDKERRSFALPGELGSALP